jgi:ParB family chromosome partitioning protein
MEMTIIENLQREDLGPMEQARAFDRLSREFGLTQEQMSVRTGKERSTISNYLRLLKLPFDVQLELEHNFKITLSHAKLLLMLNTDEEISRAAREIVSRNLSVIQTEDLIFDMKNPIAREPKPVKPVDPNVRAAQRELEASLGCRVRIKDKNGKGKIVIEYARLEDFDRVIEILGRK